MTTPDDAGPCPECGAATMPGARYCEACGHELAAGEPTDPAIVVAGAVDDSSDTAIHQPPENATGPADATGHVDAAAPATSPAHGISYGTSSAPPPGCASCGHPEINPDSYCENCGTRRPATAAHSDVDLGGLAGVSDIGSRHHHNEDAMGLAAFGCVTAAVVCDGVSSSTRPDTAATAAALAATNVFVAALPALATAAGHDEPGAVDADANPEPTGDDGGPLATTDDGGPLATTDDGGPLATTDDGGLLATTDDVGTYEMTAGVAVLHDAAAAAQAAAALVAGDDGNPNPPSTTFVAAIVTAVDITVGWVGDSRAYWVPNAGTPAGPSALTVDDTLAGQLGAAGVAMAADAPSAGALIRWLGADAIDTEPHIVTLVPPGPGRLIVCSDGLYRYVPQPDRLANATPVGRPIDVASALVRLALEAGGHDNVTVVVLPYPPEGDVRNPHDEPSPPPEGAIS